MTRPAEALDQSMPVQNGVNGALGRDANVASQAAHQELTNLARTPMRLVLLERDDQALDLGGELVGIAHRAP